MCECLCVRGLSFGFPVKQGASPQEVILGRKITLVHCRCSFLPLFSYIPRGAGVLFFVMKYVPIEFLNINPRRPINKWHAACRRNTSRSFAVQTWVLQATEGLGRLWEITVHHRVDVRGWTMLAVWRHHLSTNAL